MKPAPDPLLHAARVAGVPVERSVMVGDSGNDVAAARAAGCPVYCVTYGYNHGQDIRASGADGVMDSLAELPDLLGLPADPNRGS